MLAWPQYCDGEGGGRRKEEEVGARCPKSSVVAAVSWRKIKSDRATGGHAVTISLPINYTRRPQEKRILGKKERERKKSEVKG